MGCRVNQETFKMKPYSTNLNYCIFALRTVVLEQLPVGDSRNHFIKPETFIDKVHQSQVFPDYCTQ